MTRETSIEAYQKIKEAGLLSRERFRIYAAVVAFGPCTSGEAFKKLEEATDHRSPLSQSRARFTELRDLGVIEEAGVRPCGVTGRNCIVWETTGRLPGRVQRQPSKLDEAQKRIRELEAENQQLRAEIAKRSAQGRLL